MFKLTKLPMLVLMYHPTLFASMFTSLRNLIISAWYAMFCLFRGAVAAVFACASCWWLDEGVSCDGRSYVGKGKQFVTSRSPPFVSMPTSDPVATVGKACELCLMIFMTTRASICTARRGSSSMIAVEMQKAGEMLGREALFAAVREKGW